MPSSEYCLDEHDVNLHVSVQADSNSSTENRFKIWRLNSGGVWELILKEKFFLNNMLNEYDFCLKDNECYQFLMRDVGYDGICCENGEGNYNISFDGVELYHPPFTNGVDNGIIEFGECPTSTP